MGWISPGIHLQFGRLTNEGISTGYDMVCYMLCPQACDSGRGAVLMSVARGKVSEGIDFGMFLKYYEWSTLME